MTTFKTSSDKSFIQLTPDQQYNEFTAFEKRMRPYMDQHVYPQLGWTVKRSDDYYRDFIASDGKQSFDVEEKFKTSIWNDCAIELLQDAGYRKPFAPSQLGWFYVSTSRYLVYVFAKGMDADKPHDVYLVSFTHLRAKFHHLIEQGFNHKIIKSAKGRGLSFSVGLDWEDLVLAEVARKII